MAFVSVATLVDEGDGVVLRRDVRLEACRYENRAAAEAPLKASICNLPPSPALISMLQPGSHQVPTQSAVFGEDIGASRVSAALGSHPFVPARFFASGE
jgi:hypothetical protein